MIFLIERLFAAGPIDVAVGLFYKCRTLEGPAMSIPRCDREVDVWIEAIAGFVEDDDFEHAMRAICELTTYLWLFNLRLESCNGKA